MTRTPPSTNSSAHTRRSTVSFRTRAGLVVGPAMIQGIKVAYDQAKSWDGDKLAAAMESFKNVELLPGPTTFTKDLHISVDRPVTIQVVENGKLKFVTRQAPERVVFLATSDTTSGPETSAQGGGDHQVVPRRPGPRRCRSHRATRSRPRTHRTERCRQIDTGEHHQRLRPSDTGSITADGVDITRSPAYRRSRRGLPEPSSTVRATGRSRCARTSK